MSKRTRNNAPAGLSPEAAALWRQTLADFTFEPGCDLTLLAELCRTLDRLREVQAGIKAVGLMVAGASGQQRLNPLLQHEDQLRRTLLAHHRALRLSTSPEF